jgi:hypothetical protein
LVQPIQAEALEVQCLLQTDMAAQVVEQADTLRRMSLADWRLLMHMQLAQEELRELLVVARPALLAALGLSTLPHFSKGLVCNDMQSLKVVLL